MIELAKEDHELQELLRSSLKSKLWEEDQLLSFRDSIYTILGYYSPDLDSAGVHFIEQYFTLLTQAGRYLSRLSKDIKHLKWVLRFCEARDDGYERWTLAYNKAMNLVSIGAIVRAYLGDFNPKRNLVCPFHEDASPSFKVYEDTNSFYCFGCSASGGPVNFVMLKEGLSFKDAVWRLSDF